MKPSWKIKIKRFAIYCIACFLIVLISSPFVIIWTVNTTYIKDKISLYLYQKADVRIHSSKFSLTLFPQPGIKINHLNIHPDPTTQIDIQSIRLTLDLPALVQGNFSLGKIIINHPQIQAFSIKEQPADAQDKFSFSTYMEKINQSFDLLPKAQSELEVIVKNAASKYFENLDASLVLLKNGNKLRLNTTVKKIVFSPLSLANPDIKKNLDIELASIEKLKINATIDDKPSIRGNIHFEGSKLSAKNKNILFNSDKMDVSFTLSDKFQRIHLAPIQMNYPAGSLGIKYTNNPTEEKTNLIFSGKNIQVGQARETSLTLFKDVYVALTLFDILLDGIVPKIEVSFQSNSPDTLLDEHKLLLSGNITNGKAHIPQTPLIASKVIATTDLKNGILNIKTSQGALQTTKIETGTLAVDLLNHKDVIFNGEFSLDLDLAMLPKTLISLLPDSVLAEELSQVHNVKGRCKSTLNLAYENDSEDLFVHVQTEDFSTTGQYDRIPGEIQLNNINVEYKPDQITLSNCRGMINDAIFNELDTTIQLKAAPYIQIHKGSGIVELSSIIPWLMSYPETQKIISPIKNGKGKVFVSSIALSGPIQIPDEWKYDLSGRIDDINLSSSKKKKQLEHLSCNYKISDNKKLFENIQTSFHNLDLLSAVLPKKYLNSIQTPFKINNAHLKIRKKSSSLTGNLNFSSGPQLQLDLKGKKLDSLRFNNISLTDADISNAQVSFNYNKNRPMFHFNGSLNTTSLNKLIKPRSFFGKKLKEITEGQPVRLYIDKNDTLNIITKKLNLNSFLSSTKSNDSFIDTRILTKDLIKFKAEQLKVKNLTFTDVQAKISSNKTHSYVRLEKANLCDLKTKGYLNIKNKKIYANFPFEANNKKNIQSLLTCLFQKNEFMDGPYSFACNLTADGVAVKEISSKLNGTLTLNSKDGRIHKLTLLSRILSVLNVSTVFKGKVPNVTQEGFAYKDLTVQAQIIDSVIHLKHAVIDGKDMTMIFSGTIDPLNDKIDIVCLVAPFKTVDLIIEKIPIINTLLGGRLVSVPVKAEGKLSDPSVIPLHPSAVGTGIINMMSTILKSPVILWEKMSEENDPSTGK